MAQDDPSPASDRLVCPFCEKKYRYQAELAGRKVRCGGCEAKLKVPEAGGAFEVLENPPDHNADADGEDYDLSDPAPGPGGGGRGMSAGGAKSVCPSCNAAVKPTASLCVNCGFDLKEGKRLETRVEQEVSGDDRHGGASSSFTETSGAGLDHDALAAETEAQHYRQETLYPLILLGAGVALLILNATVLFPRALNSNAWAQAFGIQANWLESVWLYTKATAVQTLLQLPLMLAAIFLTAALFSSNYGTLGKAMIKLLALVLVVSCFEDACYLLLDIWTGGFGGIGFMLVLALSVAVFFSLAMPLFDMDVNEAFVLWFITLIGPWVINFLIKPTLKAWGIPVI